jgi:hypothetical protein
MKLQHGLHLAYCTNIHRGESWAETFAALNQFTLKVRDRVSPGKPYAIGLRLSDKASRELQAVAALNEFKKWLREENLYVFTINGFPYGQFHGTRVKEQVYRPDWSTQERLDYTIRLFEILAEILPDGVEGSVSTMPGSFKEFINDPKQLDPIFENLDRCAAKIVEIENRSGKRLHLGLEPEPLCLFETTDETIGFIQELRNRARNLEAVKRTIGVNYDTCHLAVEFEQAGESLSKYQKAGILVSKIHLSSALKVRITSETIEHLRRFQEGVYFHQVVVRDESGNFRRFKDLPDALKQADPDKNEEWRIHFHIPLHCPKNPVFDNTTDHLQDAIGFLGRNPGICKHLEMETYTWEVLPPELKNRNVVDQLESEYRWMLAELQKVGIG